MARIVRTAVDYAILEALGRYRLLTIQQGVELGLANAKHVAERLRNLHRARLVLKTERGGLAGPHVFCLSKKGSYELEEWTEGGVKAPFRPIPFKDSENLNQRILIVDWHIALRRWATLQNVAVNWVRVEFDANPGELQPPTVATHDGQRYTPDAVASITDPEGTNWLLVLEAETGGRAASLAHYFDKLASRLAVIEGHLLEKAIGWPKNDPLHKAARLLFLFKNKTMLENARLDAAKKSGLAWRRVFMASAPLDTDALDAGWWKADGSLGDFLRPVGVS